MVNVKQLINFEVCDGQGKPIGKIDDAALDLAAGKCLIAVNGTLYEAENVRNNVSSVTVGETKQNGAYPTVLNKSAYDTLGKYLGTVEDVTLSKTLAISKIVLDNGQAYAKSRISAVADVVLIKAEKPQKPRTKRTNAHKSIPAAEQAKQVNEINRPPQPIPRRYGDFGFLLGKTSDKNITNFYGEVMIRAGETVTTDILRQAKISGKLIELCLHVKN